MGFDRMIDFIYHQWGEKLSEFSPSIWPMMVDFQTLAHIILTGEEREYFKEWVENFLDREVWEHESKILKYPFDRFKHLVETYPDITTSSISIQE
jgi:hypothetical protein